MPHILFRSSLPVVVLEAGTSRTISALQSTNPTSLTASLTQTASSDALTFTLSELSARRILLLEQTITADSYAALRESQSLRIDFVDFPRELSAMLRRPEMDQNFIAVLSLASAPLAAHTFEVVQLSDFRLLTHVELKPVPASPDALLNALAARARDAETAAITARAEGEAARTELVELSATLASVRAENEAVVAELGPLRTKAAEAEAARGDAVAALAEVETLRRELATAQRERSVAEDARNTAETVAANARREADELRTRVAELPAAIGERERERARVAQMAAEVRRANATVERLRRELRTARERLRTCNEIVERQESTVTALETRVAEGDREKRRFEDLANLRQVERDGFRGRVDVMQARAEETAVLLATDRECIAFLNRELNHRDMLLSRGTPERTRGRGNTSVASGSSSSRVGAVGGNFPQEGNLQMQPSSAAAAPTSGGNGIT